MPLLDAQRMADKREDVLSSVTTNRLIRGKENVVRLRIHYKHEYGGLRQSFDFSLIHPDLTHHGRHQADLGSNPDSRQPPDLGSSCFPWTVDTLFHHARHLSVLLKMRRLDHRPCLLHEDLRGLRVGHRDVLPPPCIYSSSHPVVHRSPKLCL